MKSVFKPEYQALSTHLAPRQFLYHRNGSTVVLSETDIPKETDVKIGEIIDGKIKNLTIEINGKKCVVSIHVDKAGQVLSVEHEAI